MRRIFRLVIPVLSLAALLLSTPLFALEVTRQQEFDHIAALNMADLTREAALLMRQKYPDEKWDAWRFPAFVFTNESVEVSYKIAVKEPQILGSFDSPGETTGIPCYCFCDAMGHKSLVDCFWKDGKVGGAFDDHAVDCAICYGQAMLAFLWKNLGATEEEIRMGMERKFGSLPKPK